MDFSKSIKEFTENLGKDIDVLRIVLGYNKDSLVISCLLSRAFIRKGIKFVISFRRNLTTKEFENEGYKTYLFVGFNKSFELSGKKLFFIGKGVKSGLDIKDNKLLDTLYSFLIFLDEKNRDLLKIAILGNVSDELIEEAVNKKLLEKEDGFYGYTLFRFFYENFAPYLPSISGNRAGIMKFLNDLGLDEKSRLNDLIEEDVKRLTTEVELKKLGSEEFGENYYVKEGELKTLREYNWFMDSLLSNLKPGLFPAFNFGDKKGIEEALSIYSAYKKEMINALDWFMKHRKSSKDFVIMETDDSVKFVKDFCDLVYKMNIYQAVVCISYLMDDRIVYFNGLDISELNKFVKEVKGDIFEDHFIVNKDIDLNDRLGLFLSKIVNTEKIEL